MTKLMNSKLIFCYANGFFPYNSYIKGYDIG